MNTRLSRAVAQVTLESHAGAVRLAAIGNQSGRFGTGKLVRKSG
jgi:hypothetical protein